MPQVTPESWRSLPARSEIFAELVAHPLAGVEGVFLAVDHDGARHLLLPVPDASTPISDDHSRGIHAITRPLSVQKQQERQFIDVLCTATTGQDVFNLVGTAIVEQFAQGADVVDAVRTTLARWRRFWGAAPTGGLTPQEIRGLFGELWFLTVWVLPTGLDQVAHWLGPTGARHDFQWPQMAIECKTTASVRGHIHRINGLDQLDPPADGALSVFSLRLREEVTASNSVASLVRTITAELSGNGDALSDFESRLMQVGYSPVDVDRYDEQRYRVINERLYAVTEEFPRLSAASFAGGLPAGIERVEYDVDLDAVPQLVIASSPAEFEVPAS
jgi:hypothetical protein